MGYLVGGHSTGVKGETQVQLGGPGPRRGLLSPGRTLPRGCPGHSGLRALAAACPWCPRAPGGSSGTARPGFFSLLSCGGERRLYLLTPSSPAAGSEAAPALPRVRPGLCRVSHSRRAGRSVGNWEKKDLALLCFLEKTFPAALDLDPHGKDSPLWDSVREPGCLRDGCACLCRVPAARCGGACALLGEERTLGLGSLICRIGDRALNTHGVLHVNEFHRGRGCVWWKRTRRQARGRLLLEPLAHHRPSPPFLPR